MADTGILQDIEEKKTKEEKQVFQEQKSSGQTIGKAGQSQEEKYFLQGAENINESSEEEYKAKKNLLIWKESMTIDEIINNLVEFSASFSSGNRLREKGEDRPYGSKNKDGRELLKEILKNLFEEAEEDYEHPLMEAVRVASNQIFKDGNHRMTMAVIYVGLQKHNITLNLTPKELFYELYNDRGEDLSDKTNTRDNLERLIDENDEKQESETEDMSLISEELSKLDDGTIKEFFLQKANEKKAQEIAKWDEEIDNNIPEQGGYKYANLYDKDDLMEVVDELEYNEEQLVELDDEYAIVYYGEGDNDLMDEIDNELHAKHHKNV